MGILIIDWKGLTWFLIFLKKIYQNNIIFIIFLKNYLNKFRVGF